MTTRSFRCNLCVLAALFVAGVATAQTNPNPSDATGHRGHAHNDYLHQRPLLDALDQGFSSVEADIYLIDGQLLVAHDRDKVSEDRTLVNLYLDPLRDRVNKNNGSVHGNDAPFTLLIDIKSDGAKTYEALDKVLSQYADVLTSVDADGLHRRAVTVIVSGNRATELIAADRPRYVGIDGRLTDLESDVPAETMPLISDNWGKHFSWRGEGPMPAADREKLADVIAKAHAKNRRIRLWATPDRPAVWAVLDDAGVDLINTDDLAGLMQFLRSR
ncbi:phosphatidylinositol-specific phospholipase C/glycerophosphodiester phosphodiesterase family protein [Stieleria sp. TO1_6]|uniref:phosphatidylinositol-specific phospholipase C/glycerophosphodiester phosphodiesterase family protein n=1 Tax=Stieleria tagensis TaxID=2956795 RepID=UPI00209A9E43|nr:phosphatidylinositol-specific phospholipase C/glycerophosphodiester phosphodiesterase family protein [Stieleria tagensis]MCO8125316.1 phosphatidylinositol-specific phospholipase C/glycerophosphodiester phosphodiesterase family protein [Stieleria tagensis]